MFSLDLGIYLQFIIVMYIHMYNTFLIDIICIALKMYLNYYFNI